jgi:hypothetical protein
MYELQRIKFEKPRINPEVQKKKENNRKRSNTISALKRKNLNLIKLLDNYIETLTKETPEAFHLSRLRKDASRCANFSLYGTNSVDSDIKYFASVLCGNKTCFVCNFARQKRVRRKYFKWFAENPTVLEVKRGEARKIVTRTRLDSTFEEKGFKLVCEHKYDIMHLTLTVPHYANGFNGERYYFQLLADLFHDMRNEAPEWNELVYGGEYGIETTQTQSNGLHIHIHSLLFVRQATQNRNRLHKLILKEWNRRTVNRDNPRTAFDDVAINSIKRSNRLFDDDFVKGLDPQGTTMINLESIYSFKEGEKVRTSEFNSKEMLYAIMEAIKYHFEPLAFDKENKTFDLDLMAEVAPRIYRKQLYKKFGCLHGEKSLNLKEDDTLREDFDDATDMIDQETGEIKQEYDFFITSPAYIYHSPEKDNKLMLSKEGKKRLKKIEAFTVSEAVTRLGDMVKAQYNYKQSQTLKN